MSVTLDAGLMQRGRRDVVLRSGPAGASVDTIELRGLTFYGYHGAHDEEQRLGQRFVIDVRLGIDLEPAGRSDDLSRTVNYGLVAESVRGIVEGPPFRLIESLAEALAAAILEEHVLVAEVHVRVAKPSAPVAVAPTGLVAVEIHRRRASAGIDVAASSEYVGVPRLSPSGSVLPARAIAELLDGEPPLLEPIDDRGEQLQPNGFDLTLESVWRMEGEGVIGTSNAERTIPERVPIMPSQDGWFDLSPGTYAIRFREVVALPLDVMAFGRPRSSLLRCGAAIHTAVWDAGYRGRSEALFVVHAEGGVRLAAGARVLQLVFVRLESTTHAYSGAYQGENL
jgi:dUTP pyrophosphatase